MKEKIRNFILRAATAAYKNGDLPSGEFPSVEVDEPKLEAHGDFSTNFSMLSASVQKMPPKRIAEILTKHIEDPEGILSKTEIAGPGFINFFINPRSWHSLLERIYREDTEYGATNIGKGKNVQVEFVSANPTGPLHVGHGRGAAVGDTVANILSFCGFNVEKEYYVNDSGKQIHTLGLSVYLRYKELCGEDISFPENCYQGDYIKDLAKKIKDQESNALLSMSESESISHIARLAAQEILEGIQEDLKSFSVKYDRWFSEQSLYDSGKVEGVINDFRKRNIIYEKDGALWFHTADFGDEKDRVVVKGNGETTYFASDIAYHQDKFDRGFDKVIDVWGADHHGYIPRMTAAIEASGRKREQFKVILVQFVNLLRGGIPVAMSTRAGEFVTLKDVTSEVGADAARFLFLTRHYESPLDFDLEIAKKKTNENPVYYVQYVHARISSIIRKGEERGVCNITWDEEAMTRLKESEEIQLIKIMSRYPGVVRSSAEFMEPHRIAFYLVSLATAFHAYYNKHRVLTEDPLITQGRLYLVIAVKKVIRNGLALLGVSAPEQM